MMERCQTTCPYCGVGCGVVIEYDPAEPATSARLSGDKEHPANWGRLCSKGKNLLETIDLDARLLHPVIHGQRTSWDVAIDTVASRFAEIHKHHGKDAVAFYVSGQILTEDYYVANKLMKGGFGSANIDTNSRLCMSSAVAGYKRAFGMDTVPVSYADVEQADLIIFVGSNAAWTHPVLFQRVLAARKQRPDMTVIAIDPRQTATTDMADIALHPRAATDGYLFNGLLAYLAQEGALDADFLAKHVDNVEETLESVQEGYSIAEVAEVCGLSTDALLEVYQRFAATPATVMLYSQGINQSSSAVDTINGLINCFLATGRVGKPGCGPFSLTGQPNAMGGREVGGLANQLAAHMDFSPDEVDRVRRFWQTEYVADTPGVKTTELPEAIMAGKVKAVWIMATNPTVSLPNSDAFRDALKQCEFVVVSDCVAANDTLAFADVLLPATSWGENAGMVTNSERMMSRRRAWLPQPGEARSDWEIICQVAQAMGILGFDYSGVSDIFREYAALTGFENYGSRDLDISEFANMRDAAYEHFLPQRWGGDMFRDGAFFTPNKKARMMAVGAQRCQALPDRDYPLLLNTGRVRDQWHTMTRTGKSPTLGQHRHEPQLLMHPDDASVYQVESGRLLRLVSKWGGAIVRMVVDAGQRPGEVFFPIHWSHTHSSQGPINRLVNPFTDPISGQPEFKQTPVAVQSLAIDWYGYVLTAHRLDNLPCEYQVVSRGKGFFRYEIAGMGSMDSMRNWLESDLLGEVDDTLLYADPSSKRYRYAGLTEECLDIAVFIGTSPLLPEHSWVASMIGKKPNDSERGCLLSGMSPSDQDDKGEVICSCAGVGLHDIQRWVKQHAGTVSVESVGDALGAGVNCGSCVAELKRILGG
jgi:assimilatory nitrate reductase catalytic subunit